jgi:hypothetical protein
MAAADLQWEKRQQWLDSVVAMREGRILTEQDQELLVEHYDRVQRDLGAAVAELAPEYARRIREDGKDAADEWLAAASHELGVRSGRELRQTVDALSIDGDS